MRRQRAYILLTFFVLLWTTGFLAAPLLSSSYWMKSAVYEVYGRVCHQLPDRSFEWFGGPWAVCHRCAAIYLSFTAMLLVFPLLRPLSSWKPVSGPFLLLCLAPMAADVVFNLMGIHDASMASRIVSGGLAGLGLCMVVAPLFLEAVQRLMSTNAFSRRTVC